MKPATGIIPARFHSSRFPGKPLVHIKGKPLIQRVYEKASTAKLLKQIIVATDDERVAEAVKKFGAEVQMTSSLHESGTERTAEVAQEITTPIIINIQGDEPLIKGEMLDELILALQDESISMASLMAKVYDLELIHDTNIVKVVVNKDGYALNFSRFPLPLQTSDYFLQHIGIYGFQRNFLLKFAKLPPKRMEKAENLEQLRALEHGFRIKMFETQFPTLSIDVPQDIIKLEKFLEERGND